MAKPAIEFSDTIVSGDWRPVRGACQGIFEKILAHDPVTGHVTRLVRYGANARIPTTQVHDYCEEVYVLEGYMIDTAKNVTASKGFYACRPVGMIHGPYEIPVHCLCFEVRYQDPEKAADPNCSLLK